MLPATLIKKKRNGGQLHREEIEAFFTGYLKGQVTDYQMSAFLMAVFFQGLSEEETLALTQIMWQSGKTLEFRRDRFSFFVDKHSTGGGGDKTSLILAPIVASLGYGVPMISGRALGHTGGTLDKLESIPGFRTRLSLEEFKAQVENLGCALIGQTEELAPLDRRLYALRDVTATVESIPLICASILSKKLAEGADGLVFDVKWGSGAFMKEYDQAKQLAQGLVGIAKGAGKRVRALLTDMNQPLGTFAGNSLEIKECVEILQGSRQYTDTRKLSLHLAAHMIQLAEPQLDFEECLRRCEASLENGKAMEMFEKVCLAQGGRLEALPLPKQSLPLLAPHSGQIVAMDTEAIGWIGVSLGMGRKTLEDKIQPTAGFEFHKKVGDLVEKGEPIVTLWGEDSFELEQYLKALQQTISVEEASSVTTYQLITQIID